jgi:hypothetical protein
VWTSAWFTASQVACGQIDRVGRGELLDTRREHHRVADEGTLLVQYVAEGEDDAQREAIIALARLGEPQLFLHAHRGQCPGGDAREDHPEPVALRLDDAAVVCRGEAGHEVTVLGQQGVQVHLGECPELDRRAPDVSLHDDGRA